MAKALESSLEGLFGGAGALFDLVLGDLDDLVGALILVLSLWHDSQDCTEGSTTLWLKTPPGSLKDTML